MNAAPLWDAEVLDRIRRLQLVARRTVDSLMLGAHRSRRVGSDIEFAEYKEYAPGDDVRDVDWRALARSDRLVVKRYQLETELACTLVLDASGDMGTGDTSRHGRPELEGSKLGYAICAAACLAWFMARHREPVGLIVLGADAPTWLPARGGDAHLARVLANLAALKAGGQASLGDAMARVGGQVRRRSLVLLISDFMEETEGWVDQLSALGRRRTDVAALHILDRRELDLDYEDPGIFYSPEDGLELPLDPIGAREEFLEVRDAWMGEVRGGLTRHGARYYPAWTDQPLDRVLRRVIGALP